MVLVCMPSGAMPKHRKRTHRKGVAPVKSSIIDLISRKHVNQFKLMGAQIAAACKQFHLLSEVSLFFASRKMLSVVLNELLI